MRWLAATTPPTLGPFRDAIRPERVGRVGEGEGAMSAAGEDPLDEGPDTELVLDDDDERGPGGAGDAPSPTFTVLPDDGVLRLRHADRA